MPTYVYECRKCKHRFELFHGMKDDSVKRCPRCKARATRVPAGGAGILFKGSGFYITDYRSGEYKKKAKEEGGGAPSPKESKAAGEKSTSKPKAGDKASKGAGGDH